MYITGAVREAGSRAVDKCSCECSELQELTRAVTSASPEWCGLFSSQLSPLPVDVKDVL